MTILDVVDLRKHYPIHAGLLRREVGRVRAVDGVSFSIEQGETLALVGESGCGKTTVARCIVRALKPSSGAIRFASGDRTLDLAALSRAALQADAPPDPDDLPGPVRLAQPAHDGGRHHRRAARS